MILTMDGYLAMRQAGEAHAFEAWLADTGIRELGAVRLEVHGEGVVEVTHYVKDRLPEKATRIVHVASPPPVPEGFWY